jgi:hypothetical protein
LEVVPLIKKWGILVVPAIAVLELALHFRQVTNVAPDDDWKAAKAREFFGDALATPEREAYPDVSRFPRALEVSIRGAHVADLAGWRETDHTKVGAITITTFDNPSPVALKDDLLRHVGKPDMHVSYLEGGNERDCNFGRNGVGSGNLGFGPAVPSTRYQCPGAAFAGISIMADLDYRPRRCLFVPGQGAGNAVRLRFDAISFGRVLHGHHGIYVEAERDLKGAPVNLMFRSGDTVIGRLVHRDGEGWKNFELDTSNLAGQSVELVVEVSSPSRDRRLYCFEADTR